MKMNKNQELKDTVLRGIVRLPCPYGVTLRMFVNEELNKDISYGKLYSILRILEEDGLIAATYKPGGAERGYRRKLVWSLV